MALYLITGMPGSGKSTVYQELKARGYDAYDADIDHIAYWFDNVTDKPVPHIKEKRTVEFITTHNRSIARDVVEKLAQKAKTRTIFLAGDPANEDDLQDLFASIFSLKLDEQGLRKRLAGRKTNSWGKLPHELEYTFSFYDKAVQRRKRPGYITIDASLPVPDVVANILKHVA